VKRSLPKTAAIAAIIVVSFTALVATSIEAASSQKIVSPRGKPSTAAIESSSRMRPASAAKVRKPQKTAKFHPPMVCQGEEKRCIAAVGQTYSGLPGGVNCAAAGIPPADCTVQGCQALESDCLRHSPR
jgi:hypothetical protein